MLVSVFTQGGLAAVEAPGGNVRSARPLLGERGRGGAADPAGTTSTAEGDVDALSSRCRA